MKVCKVCHAVCPEKHWFYDDKLYEAYHDAAGVQNVECEGCHMIKVKDFHGTVYIEGEVIKERKAELLKLIKNTEKIDRPTHYLSRVFDISEEKGKLVVRTLNQRLALNIGMQLKKTFKGKLHIMKEGEAKIGVQRHITRKEDTVVSWTQGIKVEKKKAAAKKGTAKKGPAKKSAKKK